MEQVDKQEAENAKKLTRSAIDAFKDTQSEKERRKDEEDEAAEIAEKE